MEKVYGEEGEIVRDSPAKMYGLRKEKRENWGRFLDNHFDDEVHRVPFVYQKNIPGGLYKHSASGLSHFYLKKNILEKLDAEKQGAALREERKFGEY